MYEELVDNYSAIGDVFVLVMGFVCYLIKRATRIKKDDSRHIFQAALVLLMLACLGNIGTYHLVKHEHSYIFVLMARDMYHGTLLILFAVVEWYLAMLIGYEKGDKNYKRLVYSCFIINIIGAVLDCFSPITHWGLYCDADGIWRDPVWFKPYTVFYVFNMLMIVYILLRHKDAIIKTVRNIIIVTQIIGAIFILIESIMGHNSYTTLTFALPILAVLLLLHSNPYNIENGSFGGGSFDQYLNERSLKGERDHLMFLRLYSDKDFVMPKKLGRSFYNFYVGYFKDAVLFNPTHDRFVLAIKAEKNENAEASIKTLVEQVFPKYFEEYGIDYKILIMYNTTFNSIGSFRDMSNYFLDTINRNEHRVLGEKEYKDYNYRKNIQLQLLDIIHSGNLDDDRVLVYCQPIMNVHTGKFDTAEALMRLKLPEIGMVFPDVFIPIAEEHDCIHGLSMIILNKVCKKISELKADKYCIERITVNFSMTEMNSGHFVSEYKEIIESHQIPFSSVGIEFTESTNDADYNNMLEVVTEMKKLGSPTYLDDFGTGYSNFDRILRLNVNVIKFDRSLLNLTEGNPELANMVKHFAMAFMELGYKILYEGVENEQQVDNCISSYADYIQGYFYAKPVEIDRITEYLSTN